MGIPHHHNSLRWLAKKSAPVGTTRLTAASHRLPGKQNLKSLQLRISNFRTLIKVLNARNPNPDHLRIIRLGSNFNREVKLNCSISTTSIEISNGRDTIRVTYVYKSPNQALTIEDLDKLTCGANHFISAGDLNSKHPAWNSRCTNTSGNTLYRHLASAVYYIVSPDTPTFYPHTPGHRPDVLDMALVRLSEKYVKVTNLNALSSDHNPILLTIQVTNNPLTTSCKTLRQLEEIPANP